VVTHSLLREPLDCCYLIGMVKNEEISHAWVGTHCRVAKPRSISSRATAFSLRLLISLDKSRQAAALLRVSRELTNARWANWIAFSR
jgi:hypothetical protein